MTAKTTPMRWLLVAALAAIFPLAASVGGRAQESGQTEKAKEKKMTKTESGLQYRDTKEGTGEKPSKGQTCVMHYTGWLWEDGKKGEEIRQLGGPGRAVRVHPGRGPGDQGLG